MEEYGRPRGKEPGPRMSAAAITVAPHRRQPCAVFSGRRGCHRWTTSSECRCSPITERLRTSSGSFWRCWSQCVAGRKQCPQSKTFLRRDERRSLSCLEDPLSVAGRLVRPSQEPIAARRPKRFSRTIGLLLICLFTATRAPRRVLGSACFGHT